MWIAMVGKKTFPKWICGVLAFLCLALLLPSNVWAANTAEALEVPNSGFEQELVSGKIPSWNYFSSGIQSGLSLSETTKYEGVRSLKIVKATGSAPLGAESVKLPVTPGKTYEAAIRMNVESHIGAPALWIRWYGGTGQPLNKQATYSLAAPPLNKWLDIHVNGIAPPDAAYATIFVYASTGTAMTGYADDARFNLVAEQIAVVNPGFEDPSTGTAIPGWGVFPGSPPSSVTLSKAEQNSGLSSLLIEDTSSLLPAGISTQAISIQPDGLYEAKASVYLASGGSVILYIKYYDNSGAEAGVSSVQFASPLQTWKTMKVEGIAPLEARTAKILLYSGTGALSKAYFDDVSFTLKENETLTLPHPYGQPVNLGKATLASLTLGGAIGNGQLYFVANGAPGTFYAVDAVSGNVIFSKEVPGTTETWAVTVGSDNNVYFAATSNRTLWKYDPIAKEISVVGDNPSENFVWDLDSSSDGIIYGSTYPNAEIFSYNTQNGEFIDLGNMYEDQEYVRGSGVTDHYLYAGIGAFKHLVRVDRSSGEKMEIPLPFAGNEGFVSNIWAYNGILYVAHGTSLAILDEDTFDVKYEFAYTDSKAFDGIISPPSPYDSNLLYYRNKYSNTLWTYNAATNTAGPVTPEIKLPENSSRAFNWITLPNGSQVLATLYENGKYTLFNPQDHSLQTIQVPMARSGVNIQSLAMGPDANLYLGGFIDGLSVFKESAQTYEVQASAPESPHQVEEIGFLNGKAYFGAYGGARIYSYVSSQPYHYENLASDNPKLVYTIPDSQDRPYAFASGDNKLFIGTIPVYGQLGGSLTIFNEETDQWTTHRNVVNDQSIISLAYNEGIVFGGTSIEGGLGTASSAVKAKLFKWDAAAGIKLDEIDPDIPGLPTPKLLGGLSFGPDGMLWGAAWGEDAEGGTTFAIYAMNPSTYKIVKSKLIYPNANVGNTWRSFYLRWGQDGLLYTTIARFVTVIDPVTLKSRKLVDAQTNLLDIGTDGSLYYTSGPTLFRLPVPLASASISMNKTSLKEGESESVLSAGILANGREAIMAGSAISFTSSDQDVLNVQNGKALALKPGKANIYADITLGGKKIRTNTIEVTVTLAQAEPAFTADIITPTNVNVTVYISYPADAALKEFKLGVNGTWTVYKDPIIVSSNDILFARSSDSDGNLSSVTSFEISNIDKTAPVTTASLTPSQSDGPNGSYAGPVTLTLNGADNLSGVQGTVYSLDNGITWQQYASPISFNKQGQYNIHFKSTDSAGNTEASQSVSFVVAATTVSVQLKDSSGNPLSGGEVAYYDGEWKSFGVTDANGQISKSLPSKSYAFAMTYEGTRKQLTQNTGTDAVVVFQTVNVRLQLKDSLGNPLDAGTASYYAGSWRAIGETQGGEISKELLPGSYTFEMKYEGTHTQVVQNTADDAVIVFRTINVTLMLKDSQGNPVDNGSASYYAGGWRSIGNTSGGQITKELLPGSYSFAMTYAGTNKQLLSDIATNPFITFQI